MTRRWLISDPIRERLIHHHCRREDPFGNLVFRKEWWNPIVAYDTFADCLNVFPRDDFPMRNAYLRNRRYMINEDTIWMRVRGKHFHIFAIHHQEIDGRLEFARNRPLALLNHIHPQYHPV